MKMCTPNIFLVHYFFVYLLAWLLMLFYIFSIHSDHVQMNLLSSCNDCGRKNNYLFNRGHFLLEQTYLGLCILWWGPLYIWSVDRHDEWAKYFVVTPTQSSWTLNSRPHPTCTVLLQQMVWCFFLEQTNLVEDSRWEMCLNRWDFTDTFQSSLLIIPV